MFLQNLERIGWNLRKLKAKITNFMKIFPAFFCFALARIALKQFNQNSCTVISYDGVNLGKKSLDKSGSYGPKTCILNRFKRFFFIYVEVGAKK